MNPPKHHLHLTDADFDAYGEGRARATTLTKPRTEVKARLLAWGQAVVRKLDAEGIELAVAATDEHPTSRNGHRVEGQTIFLFRDRDARQAMRTALGSAAATEDEGRLELGHARIELRVDATSVALLVWLGADARIDLEAAIAVLESSPPTTAAEEAWALLPAGIAIDARPTLSARARSTADLSPADGVRIAHDALDAEVPMVIGMRLPRARALEPGALDPLFDVALALGRFLAAVAWSPERASARTRAPRERPSSRRSRRARAEPAASPSPGTAGRAEAPIDRGARVRALAGPFAGQSGVVQELDGKGGARVLFGLLAARVELRDLTVTPATAKRGRALLSSSHRKPGS